MQHSHPTKTSKILGALWGATLGDIIGAHLQFDKDITKQKITNAFKIIGGGKHNLQPGQPTDDSQLNYAVCKGLIRGNGKFNVNFVAEEMGNWFLSKPIDVGGTIRNSVPKACNMKVHQAHVCRKGAKERSEGSQSNGTLMAIIGFALWCHRLPPQQIIEAVAQYTKLVHPNQVVILCNSFYTLMVSYFLNNQKIQSPRASYEYSKDCIIQNKLMFKAQCLNEFMCWLTTIQNSFDSFSHLQQKVPLTKLSGWIRIAFSYTCHFACQQQNQKKSYYQIIKYLISNKGDTDTNACIIGGMVGVMLGLNGLNMDQQIEKIKKWRSKGNRRPEWMVPGLVVDKIAMFIQKQCPQELVMIGAESQYNKQAKLDQKNKQDISNRSENKLQSNKQIPLLKQMPKIEVKPTKTIASKTKTKQSIKPALQK